ncbi:MAG: alpha-galactosidase [Acetatifactor sp.]|nr:alpha-galactosidase [Acetatifactor sp.]
MIKEQNGVFELSTPGTTYGFYVRENGICEHLYYGDRINLIAEDPSLTKSAVDALREKWAFPQGNTNVYDSKDPAFSMENGSFEFSERGKGDPFESFIEVIHADGGETCDFVYESHRIGTGKLSLKTMPSAYDAEDSCEYLVLRLKCKNYAQTMELVYHVFNDTDCITRSTRLINTSDEKIRLKKLSSLQLDLPKMDYDFVTFNGSWANEMNKSVARLSVGKHINSSYHGVSSSRANPFVCIAGPNTDEDRGEVYGFNLIYSGNHREVAEVTPYGKTRIVTGINPESFEFVLSPGEEFEAPEAVISYSPFGYNGLSHNFHHFVNEHIVRGEWKKKDRPILINSWEANYFDIDEKSLVNLAKKGRDLGMELFVMDDGWFGKRKDDTSSLGDWSEDRDKLPGGIKRLSEKINALGMDFGLWVEPEMVNTDSDLYRAHPDWVMDIPGKDHSEGRNQRILDLANPEVVDYLAETMTGVFSSGNVSYVKWDMNRTFTDAYSKYLTPEHRQETFHRYVCGFYRLMKILTERFPGILFEGCASGGNRFDLGMLSFFPQIWGSDNTDATCRSYIQNGYSYGYPQSCYSAHVSASPNHQTLRVSSHETRFNIAAFAPLGYELNLKDLKKEELDRIKGEIALYKTYRHTLQFGDFYRSVDICGNYHEGGMAYREWTVVSDDKSEALGMFFQEKARPSNVTAICRPKGLDPDKIYRFYNIPEKVNIKTFGDLVNAVSPVHIKNGSMAQSLLALVYKLNGEKEDYILPGRNILNAGVRLCPAFAGNGFNEHTRVFTDGASRLYIMEEVTD